jgi:endo-1,4-beta-mannosidase
MHMQPLHALGADPEVFRLGVNYWPGQQAMGWLRAYDPVLTRRDFLLAKSAGFDTIRIFLRWEDVQPTASTIDPIAIGRVVDAADAAVEVGVTVLITLFVGHMSGVNWIPGWALGGEGGDQRFRVVSGGRVLPAGTGLRNWYADPVVFEAQERLAAAAAQALAGHPGVWGWDLGNENSNCTLPPHRSAGEAWLERMSTAIRRGDPGSLLTIGLHMEDLEQDRRIGPAEAARWCEIVSMHGYPIYADWSAGSTDDVLLSFLAEVTRWLASGAPVLFEELGLPTTRAEVSEGSLIVDEEAAAGYMGRALDGLRETGCVGAFVWCFSDYVSELAESPPFDSASHELSFGLWRADGTAKPALEYVSARAGSLQVAPQSWAGWLDIDRPTFDEDRRFHLARLYRRFRGRDAAGL